MQKINFLTFHRDTGSNYNSFVGHYSSMEKLIECLKNNPDFMRSLYFEIHNRFLKEDLKQLFNESNVMGEFSYKKNDYGYLLSINFNKLPVQKKIKTIIPEVKIEGQPYQPQRIDESLGEIEYKDFSFSFTIRESTVLLDVIHYNYNIKKTLDGEELPENDYEMGW